MNFSSPASTTSRAWGFSGPTSSSPGLKVIDDDAMPMTKTPNSSSFSPNSNLTDNYNYLKSIGGLKSTASSLSSASSSLSSSAASAGSSVGSAAGGPMAVAKMVQDLSNAGVDVMKTQLDSGVQHNYNLNSTKPGMQSQLQAEMIAKEQMADNNTTASFAKYGSFFGPVGTLIGGIVGEAVGNHPDPNSSEFKTAYTSSGRTNPQNVTTVDAMQSTSNSESQQIAQ